MADNVSVRVRGTVFGYDGNVHQVGDELMVPADVAEKYPRSLEVIESGSDETENPDESSPDETSDGYTRGELKSMDYDDLSQLAMESDNPEINGRSSTEDIIEALSNE